MKKTKSKKAKQPPQSKRKVFAKITIVLFIGVLLITSILPFALGIL